jgi:lysophospholipase L1-like esterase
MPGESHIRAIAVFACMLVAQITQAQENNMTIGLIGDSTVATTYGWGPAFAADVKDQVRVLNYAKNGATLDSLSKTLDELLKEAPDYVIIQFGHNDMKRYDVKVYGEKLKGYVKRVIAAGSRPIIFSSVTRRVFDENGKIKPAVINGRTLHDYALSAKSVAEDTKVPFLDLNTISIEHHNRIGPEKSATYNFNPDDRTHFSEKGAREIAALIIKELKTTVPELAPYFKESPTNH